MMFVFGEVAEPLEETTELVEELCKAQMIEFTVQSVAQAHKRGSKHLGAEDLMFLIRHDRKKTNRLRTFLSWKDVRKMNKDKAGGAPDAGDLDEAIEDTAGGTEVKAKANKIRIKFSWDLFNTYGNVLSDDEGDDEDEDEQQAYNDQISRLRNNPNADVIDILGFLACECVARLTETGLQVKKEWDDRDKELRDGNHDPASLGKGYLFGRNTFEQQPLQPAHIQEAFRRLQLTRSMSSGSSSLAPSPPAAAAARLPHLAAPVGSTAVTAATAAVLSLALDDISKKLKSSTLETSPPHHPLRVQRGLNQWFKALPSNSLNPALRDDPAPPLASSRAQPVSFFQHAQRCKLPPALTIPMFDRGELKKKGSDERTNWQQQRPSRPLVAPLSAPPQVAPPCRPSKRKSKGLNQLSSRSDSEDNASPTRKRACQNRKKAPLRRTASDSAIIVCGPPHFSTPPLVALPHPREEDEIEVDDAAIDENASVAPQSFSPMSIDMPLVEQKPVEVVLRKPLAAPVDNHPRLSIGGPSLNRPLKGLTTNNRKPFSGPRAPLIAAPATPGGARGNVEFAPRGARSCAEAEGQVVVTEEIISTHDVLTASPESQKILSAYMGVTREKHLLKRAPLNVRWHA
ncbi:Transcription initiation protein spt3 [Irineochytrium annulatum]|nr:Transcription initiation protein spt3 [Irineochytrium annulatum]